MARRVLARTFAIVLALCMWAWTPAVQADARTDFLRRMLQTSSQFRVRVQAALALGGFKGDRAIIKSLSQALGDKHPAVRSAAAAALGRLGDRSALGALRNAKKDKDRKVRAAVTRAIASLDGSGGGSPEPAQGAGPAEYYVGVGVPGTKAGLRDAELRRLRGHIVRTVSGMDGVKVAPDGESRAKANKVLKREKLVGYFIDSSVTKLEVRSDGSVRATVSVIVGTYPGRAMRAMLSGAATVTGGGASSKVQAIEAAFTGAMRRLPQAMAAGRARAAVP